MTRINWREVGWAAGVAAAVFGLQLLTQFDPDAVESWRTYVVAGAAGIIRSAAAAALGVVAARRAG